MSGQLYEVVRWGNNESEDGPDGADTCFLVRAASPEQAATLADAHLRDMPHERVQPWAHAVYLLGTDVGGEHDARVLRGPYLQHAFCHGWRQWHREAREDAWAEWHPE